jgi:hypothetical protein
MRRFKSPRQAQSFLTLHGVVRNLFCVARHLLIHSSPTLEVAVPRGLANGNGGLMISSSRLQSAQTRS